MRPPPSSLIPKLISSSTTSLRTDLRIPRAFPHSLTTSPTLPTAKASANFSTTSHGFFHSSSRQLQGTGDKHQSQQHDVKKNHVQEDTSKNGNPEFPTLSFAGLGLSRNMKILVLGLVGVLGTIETWFWCKAIWRWWKGAPEDEDEQK
ncbi:hypothetical protein AJ78_03048 [Emergomyces pasteurianus Ep9510]|uniref:Uncharacterized protein n=1 Tax=Emergomyces pasteurianus Ep9510 TaxID=1447872 RepID=A0A1J9QNI0_9EURO|nr:hypothetical protein AJ78_03048 [Emergomyces pasteurianus Ep9510]